VIFLWTDAQKAPGLLLSLFAATHAAKSLYGPNGITSTDTGTQGERFISEVTTDIQVSTYLDYLLSPLSLSRTLFAERAIKTSLISI